MIIYICTSTYFIFLILIFQNNSYRWGFTPLIEAQRFHHKNIVDFFLDLIKLDYTDQYEETDELLKKMNEKDKVKKMSLVT